MKKMLPIVLAAALLLSLSVHFVFAAESGSQPEEDMEQVILRLLYTPAFEAIKEYYGTHRQFMDERILSVQKLSDRSCYEVIMQVETFCGPHNPPYGIETMTFHVQYGEAELAEFVHQDN